jgi:hypothetical protein
MRFIQMFTVKITALQKPSDALFPVPYFEFALMKPAIVLTACGSMPR